jgi:hypothetical protein
MDYRPRFRRSITIALVTIFFVSTGSTPARAAGIGGYAAPFRSFVGVFENVFAEIIAFIDPHQAVTVAIALFQPRRLIPLQHCSSKQRQHLRRSRILIRFLAPRHPLARVPHHRLVIRLSRPSLPV